MTEGIEAVIYRVARLEHDQETTAKVVDTHDRELAVHTEQINGSGGLVSAMERLSKKVDSLNHALYAFAGSFIIAAVTIAVSISGGH